MNRKWIQWVRTGVIAGTLLATANWVAAQYPPKTQNPPPPTQNPPPPTTPDKNKTPANNSITLDDPAGSPVNAEEDAAYKAFVDSPPTDQAKRIQLGEDFVQKYPNSRYRTGVYSALTISYLQSGQVEKM